MTIYSNLYDWQKSLVDSLADKKSYGLWLKMGLGKTPLSLALAEVNKCDKILVIAPNSKATETETENGSWLWWKNKSYYNYETKHKWDDTYDNSKAEFLIVNYEAIYKHQRVKDRRQRMVLNENIVKFIESCRGHNVAVICDESHRLKNLQSQQTLATSEIVKRLSKISNYHLYLLTGTPFTTGYEDLYSQLKLLGCQINKTQFVDSFCVRGNRPGLLGWQQPIVGYKNTEQMFNLVHQYAVTATSDAVKNLLPEVIVVPHITPCSYFFDLYCKSKLKKSKLEEALKVLNVDYEIPDTKDKAVVNPFFRNIDYPNLDWLAETSGTNWLRARQLSIGFQGNGENFKWFDKSRLKMVEDFLEANEDNYIIFYNYIPELFELYDICDKLGYKIDVYCGDIKNTSNYQKYSNQSEAEKLTNTKNVIIANYDSASEGKNWQEYHQMIMFSLPLYSDYEQAVSRIARTGQKKSYIVCHMFLQNNWLDLGMKESINNGVQYSSDMFASDLARITSFLEGEQIND